MNVSLEEFKAGLEKEKKRRTRVRIEAECAIINNIMGRRYRFIKKRGSRKGYKRNVW